MRPNGVWFPWVCVIGFLLVLMGSGYAMLDAKKADKEMVSEIAKDIREIRTFLMGQRAAP